MKVSNLENLSTFLSWFNVLAIISINLLNLSNSWNRTIAVGVTATPKFLLTLLISYGTGILVKISFATLSMNSSLLKVTLTARNLIKCFMRRHYKKNFDELDNATYCFYPSGLEIIF